MTAHPRTPIPLDPARALAREAMASHISHLLDLDRANTDAAARAFLRKIEHAYPGAVQVNGDHARLSLYGSHAHSMSGPADLLRRWGAEATHRRTSGPL